MARIKPPPPLQHRIFLVDDHPIVIAGLRALLDAQPGITVCGTAASAELALATAPTAKPALVITDLTLPGRSGLDLIKDLATVLPGTPILVVSMHDEMLYAERALRAGARGYLMKEAGSEALLTAISEVLAGRISVSPRLAAKILDLFSGQRASGASSPVEKLSDREFDVFRLLGQGHTTKEIATKLHISHKTVAVHRGHIKEKLNITNATELARQAVRWIEAGQ